MHLKPDVTNRVVSQKMTTIPFIEKRTGKPEKMSAGIQMFMLPNCGIPSLYHPYIQVLRTKPGWLPQKSQELFLLNPEGLHVYSKNLRK